MHIDGSTTHLDECGHDGHLRNDSNDTLGICSTSPVHTFASLWTWTYTREPHYQQFLIQPITRLHGLVVSIKVVKIGILCFHGLDVFIKIVKIGILRKIVDRKILPIFRFEAKNTSMVTLYIE